MLLSQIQAMAPQTIAPRISLSSPRSSRASSEDLTDSDSHATWKHIQTSRPTVANFAGVNKSDNKIVKRKKKVIRQRKREEGKDDSKWRFQRGGSGWV